MGKVINLNAKERTSFIEMTYTENSVLFKLLIPTDNYKIILGQIKKAGKFLKAFTTESTNIINPVGNDIDLTEGIVISYMNKQSKYPLNLEEFNLLFEYDEARPKGDELRIVLVFVEEEDCEEFGDMMIFKSEECHLVNR